jgi:hypothetical protein
MKKMQPRRHRSGGTERPFVEAEYNNILNKKYVFVCLRMDT